MTYDLFEALVFRLTMDLGLLTSLFFFSLARMLSINPVQKYHERR